VTGRVTLALVDSSNPFQRLLQQDAEAAALRAGLKLETVFTTESLSDHLATLRSLFADPAVKPDALLVMAVRDQGLARVVHEAAAAGVHWVFLNAVLDDLDGVRQQFPEVTVTTVCPDEIEAGRVQGRQLRARAGQRVLYVQGNPRSLTSRLRTQGMQETSAGAGIEIMLAGGDWNPAQAALSVREWLRLGVAGRRPFEVVACQNDHLAASVVDTLAAVAAESGRDELRQIPVTGCDGAPEIGRRMVEAGQLKATVVLPRVTGPAVEVVGRLLHQAERPASAVQYPSASFPELDLLQPVA
jgi:ABC-type sugar transport system substrate-binding protein